jgi:hypothetical protein
MGERVLMRAPWGEVIEVEATVEALSPLMAHGWHQVIAKEDIDNADQDAGTAIRPGVSEAD